MLALEYCFLLTGLESVVASILRFNVSRDDNGLMICFSVFGKSAYLIHFSFLQVSLHNFVIPLCFLSFVFATNPRICFCKLQIINFFIFKPASETI